MTYYKTSLGNVVISDGRPNHNGYAATVSVLTGRPHGWILLSALTPATALEIQRAEAECRELASSPAPSHDCEMARARLAARKRLGMEP